MCGLFQKSILTGVLYKIYNSATDDATATDWVRWPSNRARQYAGQEATGVTTAIPTTNQFFLWKTLTEALKNGHYNYKGSLTTPGKSQR